MRYRAVGFDYGGVVTGQPSPIVSRAISNLLGVNETDYRSAYYRHNVALHRGEIDKSQFWQAVLADLKQSSKLQQLSGYFARSKFGKPNSQILDLISRLRRQGLKTAMLSNNPLEMAKRMRQDGLPAYFDVFNVSAETGLVKPQAEAFNKLAEQLGVDISELIFIDDSQKSLSTADEVGYTPVLYKNYQDLIKQLRTLGLTA